MRLRWPAAFVALAGVALIAPTAASATGERTSTVPHYDHVIEIMMENQKYDTIIGNPSAPRINTLANTYGLATNYFGVTHPSEPNYVANIGGDFFGIQDDNPFYCTPALAATDSLCAGTTVDHTVSALSLADQLTAAGKSWKGYFQNLPYVDPSAVVSSGPNANGPYSFKWPSNSNALYASKHNPFINFTGTQNALSQMVPDNQLALDLMTRRLPNYSLVVPDQCNDMHGTGGCSDPASLIQAGDAYVGTTVSEIMASPLWRHGNNAIAVTWDEDDFSDSGQAGTGCCGADPGGGHVATIVITNHGPRHLTDSTAYNHYSLLRTLEDAFGLTHLAHAGDAVVPPMSRLFALSRDH
jgi:phospholipase C